MICSYFQVFAPFFCCRYLNLFKLLHIYFYTIFSCLFYFSVSQSEEWSVHDCKCVKNIFLRIFLLLKNEYNNLSLYSDKYSNSFSCHQTSTFIRFISFVYHEVYIYSYILLVSTHVSKLLQFRGQTS